MYLSLNQRNTKTNKHDNDLREIKEEKEMKKNKGI